MTGLFVRRYVEVLGILLVLQALGGAVFKVLQERVDDLPHAGVHLLSGILTLTASSLWRSSSAARAFALGFGILYLSLGVLGYLQAPGVAALHLEIADHVFHIAVGTLTLAVGLQGSGTRTRPPGC
jgi:predicted membrane channel-forming protein YqfA (hemolysin III family)